MSRNIVLITVDSLRADHCGFMGYEKDTTPALDEMAKEGMVFENAIATSPSTPESMTAVHTGDFVTMYEEIGSDGSVLASRQSNVQQNFRNRPTIAEVLSDNGYETAAFTPNTFASRHFGFSKGFDHFTDFMETSWSARLYQRMFEKFLEGKNWLTPVRMALQRARNGEMFKPWTDFYDRILSRVETMDSPYFLWVFLLDVHLPYFVGRSRRDSFSLLDMWRYNLRLYRSDPEFSERERETLVAMYDAAIGQMDDFLSQLRTDLVDDDPVFVVHADHGEAFGEHGTWGHEPFTYEENVHIPLVISNIDKSAERADPVSLRSIPSTIASIAGVPAYFRGTDLFNTQQSYVLTTPQGRPAVRSRNWKYLHDGDGGEELYNLKKDPQERTDLSEERSEPLRSFRDLMEANLTCWREIGHLERSTVNLTNEEFV